MWCTSVNTTPSSSFSPVVHTSWIVEWGRFRVSRRCRHSHWTMRRNEEWENILSEIQYYPVHHDFLIGYVRTIEVPSTTHWVRLVVLVENKETNGNKSFGMWPLSLNLLNVDLTQKLPIARNSSYNRFPSPYFNGLLLAELLSGSSDRLRLLWPANGRDTHDCWKEGIIRYRISSPFLFPHLLFESCLSLLCRTRSSITLISCNIIHFSFLIIS